MPYIWTSRPDSQDRWGHSVAPTHSRNRRPISHAVATVHEGEAVVFRKWTVNVSFWGPIFLSRLCPENLVLWSHCYRILGFTSVLSTNWLSKMTFHTSTVCTSILKVRIQKHVFAMLPKMGLESSFLGSVRDEYRVMKHSWNMFFWFHPGSKNK